MTKTTVTNFISPNGNEEKKNTLNSAERSCSAPLALTIHHLFWFPVKTYSSHVDSAALADAAAPNSSHQVPEGSPAIYNSTPTHKQHTQYRGATVN